MSEPANLILYFALGLFIASWLWFLYMVWQVDWRWLAAGLLFVGLPLPVFAVQHWRRVKRPLLVSILSVIIALLMLAYTGDLWRDRHPEEGPDRSFSQRLLGCSGMTLWAQSLSNKEHPIENLLPDQLPQLSRDKGELAIARAAVSYAAMAYLSKEEVLAQVVHWGLSVKAVQVFERDNHFALLLITDDWLLVAFRGTDDKADWYDNLQFIPVETEWGMVHKGFDEALSNIWPEVSAAIKHSGHTKRPIWVTGHSLGGALALLASARLQMAGATPAGVVTYGQPPVGYQTFASVYDRVLGANMIRVVNHVDIVEKVFTPITPLQLTHTGKLLYLDTAGQIHEGGPDLLQRLRDAACTPGFSANADVVAHGIQMYVTQLEGR